jgi:hypothetical protein
MAMQPVIKPQETKPAPLPAYSVAPPSQTQTSSRGMVPPKHLAGGAAYAGVPKGIPHYADGTSDVYPAAAPGFEDFYKANPDLAAKAVLNQRLNGPVSAPGQIPLFSRELPANGAPTPTFSEMQAAHRGAFAQAVFGGITPQAPAVTAGTTPGGAVAAPAPTPAGPQPTVARGVNTGGLEPGGDGVTLQGQPYASTPAQVATAASHTGVSPVALQNAAGAARDAIGNPTAHTPQTFANATRGMSLYQLQQLTSMMHYDPARDIFNAAQRQQASHAAAVRAGGMVNPKTQQPYSQQDAEALALQLDAEREAQAAVKGGYSTVQKYYPSTENQ